jgi:KDO2-lipid IV(A) lauroyltransferase
VDFARLEVARYRELERRTVVHYWGAIEEAHRRGRGTILIGLHQGTWDLGMAEVVRRGYPMSVVVETLPHGGMDRLVAQVRSQMGVKLLPMDKGVRPLIHALRRNEMVGILIDQPKATANVKVQFLDRWVPVPAGAAALAARTGASVLAVGVIRGPDNTFDAIIQGPILWQPTGDKERDVQLLTQRVMDVLEEMVREHPEQWFVFRALWAED